MKDVKNKLKTIQNLLGLSQEKLAARLGVSFATMNSWINGKSSPRKKALEKIEDLFLEVTGQKKIPPEELRQKKDKILKKSQTLPNVLKVILENPDIYDQFILSLTYHSNRIEGSTFTEPETEAVLKQNVTIPNRTLIEHLEVKNHQTALNHLLQYLNSNSHIDEDLILTLHRILMNSIQPDAGNYRRHGVRIVGSQVPTANYLKVPLLIPDLIDRINSDTDDPIALISQIHSQFEQIHPFSDGNGRIGRLIIHAMNLVRNIPPAIIRQEKKRFYYAYLNRAQLTQNQDTIQLEDFLCDCIFEGLDILDR